MSQVAVMVNSPGLKWQCRWQGCCFDGWPIGYRREYRAKVPSLSQFQRLTLISPAWAHRIEQNPINSSYLKAQSQVWAADG